MKIIAIYGRGNSGKTTTLNIFIKKALKAFQGKINIVQTSLHGMTIGDLIDEKVNPNNVDNYIVLEIDGHLIGITSRGDSAYWLDEHFQHFDKCELCFCAARAYGDTHDYLIDKCKGDTLVLFKHTRTDVYPATMFDYHSNLANENMAELLFKELVILRKP